MLPTETRKQNFLSCNSMKKNKCKNNNVLFSPIILSSTMPWPRRTVRTGLSEIQMVQKRPGLVWSILTVNIEHECVLDGLERHEGVQGLAPQCPPMVRNAGSKVKQGEIILLKSCSSFIWYGDVGGMLVCYLLVWGGGNVYIPQEPPEMISLAAYHNNHYSYIIIIIIMPSLLSSSWPELDRGRVALGQTGEAVVCTGQ